MIKNSSIFTFRCSRDLSSGNDNHIFGGIIEIYHACKWYLPKNTGWETGQISRADKQFLLSLTYTAVRTKCDMTTLFFYHYSFLSFSKSIWCDIFIFFKEYLMWHFYLFQGVFDVTFLSFSKSIWCDIFIFFKEYLMWHFFHHCHLLFFQFKDKK